MTQLLPANLRVVAEQISQTATLQGKDSIDRAIQCFRFTQAEKPEQLVSLLKESGSYDAAYADHPLKYFTEMMEMNPKLPQNLLVPADRLLASLGDPKLKLHHGVASFLRTGLQEALASLKISSSANSSQDGLPVQLDELLSPQQLLHPDHRKLQFSLQVMNEMFSALRTHQMHVSNLTVSRLHCVRA